MHFFRRLNVIEDMHALGLWFSASSVKLLLGLALL